MLLSRQRRGYALAAAVGVIGVGFGVVALATVPPGTDPTILTTGLLALCVATVMGAYRLNQQVRFVAHQEGAHRRGYRTLADQAALTQRAQVALAAAVSNHGVSYVPPREVRGFHVKGHVRHTPVNAPPFTQQEAWRALQEWQRLRERARVGRAARAAARPVCARINQAFEEVLGHAGD